MKTLVINSGSSSLKYKLFDMPQYDVIAEGIVDRIGSKSGNLILKYNNNEVKLNVDVKNHEVAIKNMLDIFQKHNVIKNYSEIDKVGHRVVQGGSYFKDSVLVGTAELKEIKNLSKLAPLHNIPNSIGIEVFSKLIPTAKNIAVFDTVFHSTIDDVSAIYPVPYEWYEKYEVRKFGAHGTSHQYISETINNITSRHDLKLISCHLGNGASLAAIDSGRCIQTSMGLTPLGGIMMGTRSGDIDPSILSYVGKIENLDIKELIDKLNTESGILGISGISNDFRDIIGAIKKGNKRAQLAYDLFITKIIEYIGSYYVRLGGLDTLVFTAGIGENNIDVRKSICDKLKVLGIKIDHELNNISGEKIKISTDDSKVDVWIIPTDEEYQIAKEAEKFND